jgi:hypothetical protein
VRAVRDRRRVDHGCATGDRHRSLSPPLQLAKHRGAEILNFKEVYLHEALVDMTGGIGPDAVIDAVGLESHGFALDNLYDYAKQTLMLETDRSSALRQAIMACRKGGRISIPGVYGGVVDKFPLGNADGELFTQPLHPATTMPSGGVATSPPSAGTDFGSPSARAGAFQNLPQPPIWPEGSSRKFSGQASAPASGSCKPRSATGMP